MVRAGCGVDHPDSLAREIEAFIKDGDLREKISLAGFRAVDGLDRGERLPEGVLDPRLPTVALQEPRNWIGLRKPLGTI